MAACIERAAEQWFSTGPLAEAILASSAVPGVLPAVEIGGEHYVDGGIVNSIPISRAVELGATQIYVLHVGRIERPLEPPKNLLQVAAVTFEIARRHRFARDLASVPDGVVTHVLPAGEPPLRKPTELSQYNFRDLKAVAQRIDRAYRSSKRYLAELGGVPPWIACRRCWYAASSSHRSPWCCRSSSLAVSPVLFAVAALVDLVTPGSWRTTRLRRFLEVYLALEVVGLAGMFGLWVRERLRPPAGHAADVRPALRLHALVAARARGLHERVFQLRVVIEDRPTPTAGPILVFSRHAGPGNSLLLIGTLLVGYQRRPRIVMLAKLQWEPLFDVMLNRLPNRFIRHDPARRHMYIETIGGAGDRPRRHGRLRAVSRGQGLHAGAARLGHRAPAQQGSHRGGGQGREADPGPRPAARRRHGGDHERSGCRRRLRRARVAGGRGHLQGAVEPRCH